MLFIVLVLPFLLGWRTHWKRRAPTCNEEERYARK